ncbi:MAG TPA: DUF4012 domain-containing protein [Acidimicrobiales bacterium]|nr:DUF4012 domain-containing protein [Acidimicrobiales bacterium]
MGPVWAPAFLAAVCLTLVAIPFLRRVALATDFVDRPAAHKSHVRPVPYLGGVGLIGGVLVGLLVTSRVGRQGLVIALGAIVLGLVGLVDDHRSVDPRIRLALELGIAALAVASGLQVPATGVEAVDIALTLVWIVGITNAFNFLDNMDGLASGVASTAAMAVFMLAILGGQRLTSAVAAALAGACLAFLAYNRPPASIYMGDTGSLFLGFVLAVLTIEVDPNLAPPASFAVPVILLALPVLDTATVTLARLRRRRRVSVGGRDHLSHRLVARGLSRGVAVWVLVIVEAALGTLAVLAGRQVIPLWAAVAGAAAILATLSLITARASVYHERVVGWPRGLRLAAVGGAGALLLLAGPALVALAQAEGTAREGAGVARRALASVGSGDGTAAAADFERAGALFRRASRRLNAPLVSLGLAVPGLSSNLEASRTLASTGERLANAGASLVSIPEVSQLRVRDGSVPLEELRRLQPALANAARVLRTSREDLRRVDQPYLLPPLQRAVDEFSARVARDAELAERAAEGARLLPAMVGADRPRRYFVAFQNNAELRATGGFIGNWGELTAEKGQLRLSRFGRLGDLNQGGTRPRVLNAPPEFLDRYRGFDVADSWQQVNVSPDFPTTARVISDLYPQSGGQRVDGVIAIDPRGLSALLDLTGPVTVPDWPEPVTAANVVDITLRAAYERFPVQEERVEFLGAVSRLVFEAFTKADLGNPATIGRALSRAVRGDHVLVYSHVEQEQALITRLSADGAVPMVQGDSLMVVNQNLSANKVDFYLRRHLRYVVTLDPSAEPAKLTGRLELVLDNRAPSRGLPEGVIGPYDDRFVAGENRTYLSLYTPFPAHSATVDGEPLDLVVQPELGRLAQSATLSIPSFTARTVQLEVAGGVDLDEDGWYRLDLGHQPVVVPDEVEVSVSVPAGWRIAQTRGLEPRGERRAGANMRLEEQRSLWIRVERTGWSAFWHRLVEG